MKLKYVELLVFKVLYRIKEIHMTKNIYVITTVETVFIWYIYV